MRKKINREDIEEALDETEFLFVNDVFFRPDAVVAVERGELNSVLLHLGGGQTLNIQLEEGQTLKYVTDMICPVETTIPEEWEAEQVTL